MVMGLQCQEMATNPVQARVALYEQVYTFAAAFKKHNRSLLCRELTGCDLGTPEGQEQFKNRNLHHTLCQRLVTNAVELLEKS